MSKILIADDDLSLCESVSTFLRQSNHVVDMVHDGEDALAFIQLYQYDVLILDWDMPDRTGLEVCRSYRHTGGLTPILMLTGKTNVENKVDAFEAGADDYLTKPFDTRELLSRLRALVRRPQASYLVKPTARDIELDPATGKVFRGGTEIHLQPLEFSLLQFFMCNQGKIFSTEQIMNRVWESDASVSAEAIYSCIRRIRKKLDVDGQSSLIRNVHGRGYVFEE